MTEIETIGWIGSTLLAICGVPEAIKVYLKKQCDIGWTMLITWYLGEILAAIYTAFKLGLDPLLFNYSVNIVAITVMLYYKRGKNVR